MRSRKIVSLLIIALLLATVSTVAGCGKKAADTSKSSVKKGTIIVASKNYGEGYVLGQLAAILLQEKSDLNVDASKVGMGPTELLYPALKKGAIDLYPEYSGSLWLVPLKHKEMLRDRQQLVAKSTAEAKSKDNIIVLKPLGFNNTFAISMRPDQAKQLGITKLSDLVGHPELKLIGDSTTWTRPDVYLGMAKFYNISLAKGPMVDTNFFYDAMQQKQGDVATCFSTDGKLQKYGFTVLKDDKGYYPWYDAMYMVNGDTMKKYPEIETVLNKLSGKINEKTMISLNYKVDVEKQDPAKVAREWLKSQNLI